MLENKEEILQGYEAIIQALTDTSKLHKESAMLQSENEVVNELLQKCVEENAHSALDQAEYEERYKGLKKRYINIKNGIEGINEKHLERRAKQENIVAFIKELEQREGLVAEFDEELWNAITEKGVVISEHEITFTFKDGMELQWNI